MFEFEDIVYDTEFCVFEALEDCLDKAGLMLEHAGYTESVDDFIAEMFDVYMEATARRKKADEIDSYMKKHNYGDTNASNPAKARRARQVRNFLMVNDFDPKDGTIKSDYKDKNGNSGRIKFNLNDSSSGYYNPRGNEIAMRGLRDKAVNRALTLAHEKGHDTFHRSGKSDHWTNDPEDKSERGIKFIDKAKRAGRKINPHDDGRYMVNPSLFGIAIKGNKQSPEELEADLHAAKTARIRTKHAGKKRAVKRSGATRNVTRDEIKKSFINMQKEMDSPKFYLNDENINSQLRTIGYVRHLIALIPIIRGLSNQNFDNLDFQKYHDIFEKHSNGYVMLQFPDGEIDTRIILDYKHAKQGIDRQLEYIANTKTRINEEDSEDYLKYLNKRLTEEEAELAEMRDKLEQIEKKYPGIQNTFQYLCHTFADSVSSIAYGIGKKAEGEDDSEFNKKYYREQFEEAMKKISPQVLRECEAIFKLKTRLDIETLTKIREMKQKFKKDVRKWLNDNSKLRMDDSTKMRHDFVQHYVREYFNEFMTEYYSFENVFGVFNETA